MIKLIINENTVETNIHPGTALIDFIRENLKLSGTKEACREGECGACSVLVGALNDNDRIIYKSCASCILPIGEVKNCHIVTVEGVNMENLNTVQQIIMDNSASQCGFCTPGIVLSLIGFCLSSADFSYDDAIDALDGNICRCTGYASIKNAVKALADYLKQKNTDKTIRIETLVEAEILPDYFLKIPEMLKKISSSINTGPLNSNAIIVAGGTDLFVQKPELLQESELFFISDRKDLNYIKADSANIFIGGGVNLEDFKNSDIINKFFPAMKNYILLHSSTILRNNATLAGNIVNASPIGDITIMLLALSAILVIECGGGSQREVALNSFYKGYKKFDLDKCEIIREIKIPIPINLFYFNFEKVSNRKTLDIAAVNTALFYNIEKNGNINNLKISAGGVAAIPLLLKNLDAYNGSKITPDIIDKISETAAEQTAPIDDIRGSAKYKKLLLKQLITAHFKTAMRG